MEESKISCVQQLSEFKHAEFIESIQFSECNEHNLKMLMEVTNYFRQVFPVYVLVAQSNKAKGTLLRDKYKYCEDDLKNIETEIDNIGDNTFNLKNKLEKAKEKQCDLLTRTMHVLNIVRNCKGALTEAEKQFKTDLNKLNAQMADFKRDVEYLAVKQEAVTNKSNRKSVENKMCYFNERQVNIIKDVLHNQNRGIQSLLNDLAKIKDTLQKHELDA